MRDHDGAEVEHRRLGENHAARALAHHAQLHLAPAAVRRRPAQMRRAHGALLEDDRDVLGERAFRRRHKVPEVRLALPRLKHALHGLHGEHRRKVPWYDPLEASGNGGRVLDREAPRGAPADARGLEVHRGPLRLEVYRWRVRGAKHLHVHHVRRRVVESAADCVLHAPRLAGHEAKRKQLPLVGVQDALARLHRKSVRLRGGVFQLKLRGRIAVVTHDDRAEQRVARNALRKRDGRGVNRHLRHKRLDATGERMARELGREAPRRRKRRVVDEAECAHAAEVRVPFDLNAVKLVGELRVEADLEHARLARPNLLLRRIHREDVLLLPVLSPPHPGADDDAARVVGHPHRPLVHDAQHAARAKVNVRLVHRHRTEPLRARIPVELREHALASRRARESHVVREQVVGHRGRRQQLHLIGSKGDAPVVEQVGELLRREEAEPRGAAPAVVDEVLATEVVRSPLRREARGNEVHRERLLVLHKAVHAPKVVDRLRGAET
eukprot:Opistho-1_new@13535